jgi:hypothetical protein
VGVIPPRTETEAMTEHTEKDISDFQAEKNQQTNYSPHMQHYIEKKLGFMHTEYFLEDNQMTGTADREELGQSLNEGQ